MQVDFYELSRDPVELVTALLAEKALTAGARMLVVTADEAQREGIAKALWSRDGGFLANGSALGAHAERQPILLSDGCAPANDADLILIADGVWREEAGDYGRALLLFAEDRTEDARALWSRLAGGKHELRIFKQRSDGGWREGR